MATSSAASTASSHSSLSSRSPSCSGDEVDWRDRCQSLEASLMRFKQQAARIRELLADKMKDLEVRTQEAEDRAAIAEDTNKVLEQRLAASNWKPHETDKKLHQLEQDGCRKDQLITELQADLREQRELRVTEAQLLEEKSSKIRELVTKKIRDVELLNARYRVDNDVLHEQVATLQKRLHGLPSTAARDLHHRLSLQSKSSRPGSNASGNSFSPPIPKRPSSSVLESIRQERELELLHLEIANHMQADLSPDLDDGIADEADAEAEDIVEPDYQEIDDNHESKYEPRHLKMAPPQVRIERKIFPHPNLHSVSMISSTTGSEEMLDRERLGSAAAASPPRKAPQDLYAVPHQLQHQQQQQQQHHAGFSSSSTSTQPDAAHRSPQSHSSASPSGPQSPVTLTPRDPLSAFLPDVPPNAPSPHFPLPESPQHKSQTVSALATLPRRKKDRKLVPVHGREYEAQTLDRRLPARENFERSQSERGRQRPKPPTPPMRRLPSWENRIYAIANVGLRVPEAGNAAKRESSFPVTESLYTEQMFRNTPVPVFALVKGRAAQIRSTPFIGDSSSSDSSDNEDQVDLGLSRPSTQDMETTVSVAGPSGSKSSSSVRVRKPVNQTSSGATKRGVSSHSITSETSSDYAVPPDDDVSIQTDSSDTSEPEQKLLKYTTENLRKDSQEKHGYLTKLGGKVKNWKRRWFVLKNGELLYYKSHNDQAHKPQGGIGLDGHTRVAKTDSALTFEVTTTQKSYYFTADNVNDMEQWIRVLQNVLKQRAADRVMDQGRGKEVMKGWMLKTKHGRSRRCWCVLLGKFFMYYKKPEDKTPLGQIPLRDARVEEVDRSCDSESDSDDTSIPDYTLMINPAGHGPTYLMLPTKHEKDSWLYHLTVASGGGCGKVGTDYEQLISKLLEVDGEQGSVYWKHPSLLHTKEPLPQPLTTLPSEDLQRRALELFRYCQMFMSIAIESPQLDQHVSLAQTVLDLCLQYAELQNELYCQLIKQTSRHPPQHKSAVQNFLLCGSSNWFLCDATPTSPTNPGEAELADSKLNPSCYVFIQGWQLMSMAVSHFLPKQSVLWYLKAHLQRNADPRTDVGKYAVFCQRTMERTLHNGGREARPSRMEVLSILLRNPYHHSQPISIPVHFVNGSYQVVSFDGSTSVQEFLVSLNKALNMRDCALSGFSLFTDNPAGQPLEHHLKAHMKVCDIIAKWEREFLGYVSTQRGRPDTSKTVKLTYKNRLYFKSLSRTETDKERLLLAAQASDDIVSGRFPVNRDLAVELAALMAQIEFGDYRTPGEVSHFATLPRAGTERIPPPTSHQQMALVIDRFYPKRYRDIPHNEMKSLERIICEKWIALRGRSVVDCVRIYLTVARKWQFFGAKLFSVRLKQSDTPGGQLWLAVQEDAVSLLDFTSFRPFKSYEFKSVVTFGGHREDFMLVVTHREETPGGQREHRTNRLLFAASKAKILEMTLLMASYINSRGHVKSHSQNQTTSMCSGSDNRSTTTSSGMGTLKLLPNKPSKPFISSSVDV